MTREQDKISIRDQQSFGLEKDVEVLKNLKEELKQENVNLKEIVKDKENEIEQLNEQLETMKEARRKLEQMNNELNIENTELCKQAKEATELKAKHFEAEERLKEYQNRAETSESLVETLKGKFGKFDAIKCMQSGF